MAGPWEDYSADGPWAEYQQPQAATSAPAPLAERVARAKQIAATGQPLPPELAGDQEVLSALTQGFAQRDQQRPEEFDYGADAQARNAQTARNIELGVPEG